MLHPIGTRVTVNEQSFNVYVGGKDASAVTLVFLSGSGTCSPVLDFKTLYTLFEGEYRVAVMEKAGYGYSGDSNTPRDVDTMLEETRAAIKAAGITGSVVLLPHSLSGIEAIHWANKYPEEVVGIIGLDPALPEAYANMRISMLKLRLARFGIKSGIARLIPSIVNSSAAIQYGTLTEEEKAEYRALFYSRTLSSPMLRESAAIKDSARKVQQADITTVPLLFFASNGEGSGFSKDEWRGFIQRYIESKPNGAYVELDCAHYVHDIEYQKIYQMSMEFLKALTK